METRRNLVRELQDHEYRKNIFTQRPELNGKLLKNYSHQYLKKKIFLYII